MSDNQTTVAELRELVEAFVDARDWHRFHTPKNLAMAMAIETGELMEHFQWLTPKESRRVADQPDKLAAAAEEISDVLCYVLAMANELRLDISQAFRDKMAKNERKYPVRDYRGRYGPEDPAPPQAVE
jgi:NTP pyrophosphatase (non-canonical NTP hydrolase)